MASLRGTARTRGDPGCPSSDVRTPSSGLEAASSWMPCFLRLRGSATSGGILPSPSTMWWSTPRPPPAWARCRLALLLLAVTNTMPPTTPSMSEAREGGEVNTRS